MVGATTPISVLFAAIYTDMRARCFSMATKNPSPLLREQANDVSPIKVFRRRADQLRINATFFLVVIFALLAGGVYIFFQAPQIASSETIDNIRQSQIDDLSEEITERLANAVQKLFGEDGSASFFADIQTLSNISPDKSPQNIEEEYKQIFSILVPLLNPIEGELSDVLSEYNFEGNIERTKALLSKSRQYWENISNHRSVTDVLSRFDDRFAEIARNIGPISNKFTRLRKLKQDKISEQQNDDSNFYLFLSTQITRFGTLAVILFLVGILVRLYRYSARLASYYDARADALLLLGNAPFSIAKFEKLVGALSPETYDFGRIPTSPTQQAVDLAKEVISKVGSKGKDTG